MARLILRVLIQGISFGYLVSVFPPLLIMMAIFIGLFFTSKFYARIDSYSVFDLVYIFGGVLVLFLLTYVLQMGMSTMYRPFPSGNFSDDERAAAYGVDHMRNVWWWNDPAYTEWQILSGYVGVGDILVTEVNGTTYELMLTEGPYDYQIVLWDVNNKETVSLDLIKNPSKWQLFRSETQDYSNFTERKSPNKLGYTLSKPRLEEDWNRNNKHEVRIYRGYNLPPWDSYDSATIVVGAAIGTAITVSTGGLSLVAAAGLGAIGGGIGLKLGRWFKAEMHPRYVDDGQNQNYHSTFSHYPSAR